MDPFCLKSVALATLVATVMAKRGIKRKSLSQSGAIAAWLVGFLSICCGLRGFILLFFYLVGSKATKYKGAFKAKIDHSALECSVRGPSQVLACSAIAVACSLAHAYFCGKEKSIDFEAHPLESKFACAVLAHYATCLADTLASEMGILSSQQPILVIAPWKKVPAGTNGGVTFTGFIWSAVGGVLISLATISMDVLAGLNVAAQPVIIFGLICGLLGSLLDSVLGATVQSTFYDADLKCVYSIRHGDSKSSIKHVCGLNLLNNAQVNLVSVLATTAIGALILGPMIFHADH